MKASLLACSLLALIAGAAHAQSSVSVYGIVDLGLKIENDGGGRVVGINSGNQSGSRIGFKGTEELGNGLKANFVLESGIYADTGAQFTPGVLFNRQSYVGLAGGLGEVKLGRISTMFFSNASVFDPFSDTLAGDSARLINYFGSRIDNTVNYSFSANNGINGQLAYSFGEVAGKQNANRTLAGAIGYASGPLATVLMYTGTKNATGSDTMQTTLLGGNYNFGLLQPFATYAVNKGYGTLNTRDALLGLKINITSADAIITSIIRKTDKAVKDADAQQIALGYTHDLSKRTNFYTSWSRLNNDAKAGYKVKAKGQDDSLFNIGIRHKF